MTSKFSKVSVAISIALLGQQVVAQERLEVIGQHQQGYAIDQNSSGLKIDASWLDVPQTVSVISDQEIADRGAVQLQDTLKGVAGLNLSLGEGARDEFTLRGFSTLADIYRDGLRDGGSEQAFRSLANIERIEVLKGPAGTLYGRGSAGGLINLVTKKADGSDVAKFTVSGGSFNQQGITADLGTALSETVNGRVNLEYRDAGSYVDHVDSNTLFIAPSLRWQLAERTSIDLDLEYQKQDLVPYRGVPSKDGKPVDVDSSTFFGSVSDRQESESVRASLSVSHAFDDETLWVNKVFYSRVDMEHLGTRNKSVTDDVLTRTVNPFTFDPQEDIGFQSELTTRLGRNQLLFGLDLSRMERVRTVGDTTVIPPLTNILVPETFSYDHPGFKPNRDNRADSVALYAQDLIHFSDAWKGLVGLRYDKVDVNQKTASGTTMAYDDDKLSPRLGLVYQWQETTSLYASLGRSYQLPYRGIYAAPVHSALTKTDLAELGLKTSLLDERVLLGVSVFQIDREDPVQNAQGEIIDINDDRHRGFEVEVKGDMNDIWSMTAGYTYLDAKNKETDFKANDVPAHTFSWWNTVKPSDQLTLGGGIYYVGKRYVGNNEAVELEGYTTVDLMASYNVDEHKIQLNINNLLDEEYALGATGGSSGKHQIGFGAPRNVMLTYTLELQ